MNSTSLTVRISKEMKEQMKRIEIDWSKYIRDAIEQKIRHGRRIQAARSMDEIRKKTKQGSFDGAGSVREDRDA
jgi:predicted DNA-binding protein